MEKCERCGAVARHAPRCERFRRSGMEASEARGRAFWEDLMRRKPVPPDGYGPRRIGSVTLSALEQRARRQRP